MKHIIRLIRLPNLLIIALTMVLIRYGIIQPVLSFYGIDKFELPLLSFVFLILSVVLVAAAGNIINDYFDVKIDEINRPDCVVIGKHVKAAKAFIAYWIINIVALVLSFYVSYNIGMAKMFLIFPVTIGLLWFYSNTYKKQLLLGNIMISAFTALVPLMVIFYEMPLIHIKYMDKSEAYHLLLKVLFSWCAGYALFAFLTTFAREVIKDVADYSGDSGEGRRTLPIVLGIAMTRKLIVAVILIIIALLGYVYFKYLMTNCKGQLDIIALLYFTMLIFIPLIIAIVMIIMAKENRSFSLTSLILKLVMMTGILYMVVMRFKILNCSGIE